MPFNRQILLMANYLRPQRSFSLDNTNYLSISDANFGSFDRAKFAISIWFKNAADPGTSFLYTQYAVGSDASFRLGFAADRVSFLTSADGSVANGNLTTTATYTDTTTWHHVLVHYDSDNATAGDRMRMWVDGSEITAFDVDTNPTADVHDSSLAVNVGALSGGTTYEGLVYMPLFFSGILPSVDDLYDLDFDVTTISGLKSFLLASSANIGNDLYLTDWTNNNSVTVSTDIPS